jgi:hypothetical protein
MSQGAIAPSRVRVTATYGPVMPSLGDLTGEPPAGYQKVVAFIRTPGACPSDWFVHEDAEFTPPLLILGTYYEIDAVTESDARTQATSRFASDLSRLKLPRPPDPIHSEIADRV